MRPIDEEYTRHPFLGSRRIRGMAVRPGTSGGPESRPAADATDGNRGCISEAKAESARRSPRVYPYLLNGVSVTRINQVWSTDITYVRMARGFVYLVAVMDWYSRYVLSWALSVTMEMDFCPAALKQALRRGRPEIFNSDQGSAVHQPKVHRRVGGPWGRHQHGRARTLLRQHLRRTPVALAEVRGGLLARVRAGARGASWHRQVVSVLQPWPTAPEPAVSDTRRMLLETVIGHEEGIFLEHGGQPPNPRGLTHCGPNNSATISTLERRIGQRRGAT